MKLDIMKLHDFILGLLMGACLVGLVWLQHTVNFHQQKEPESEIKPVDASTIPSAYPSLGTHHWYFDGDRTLTGDYPDGILSMVRDYITIVFKQTGKGRRKQVQVSITPPNTCDLKNRPQDDVVRKLLKDWGIYMA